MRFLSTLLPLTLSISAMAFAAACGTSGPVNDDGGGGSSSGSSSSSGCVASLEVCDGVDNNCDGQVDEGCGCAEGDTQVCFEGDAALIGVGVCASGTQTCDASGAWSVACEGEVAPSQEVCDGADNDCNGSVDEGFGSITCGLGICQQTVEECVDGVAQACIPEAPATSESCNGIDDTCDGVIDEGCSCTDGETQPCYSGSLGTQGIGQCSSGVQTCVNGVLGACVGEVTPSSELCDGLDNDCDGNIDQGNPQGGTNCSTGLLGACSLGTEICQGGSLVCNQVTLSAPETCDGVDNDCDGSTDDGDPGGGADCSISGQLGICADGTMHCSGGNLLCTSDFPNAPIGELCNGLDDDCDGTPDDGNPEGGGNCSTGLLGVCAAGTQSCVNASLECQQNTMAGAEICNNGSDEDCDGNVDNGCSGCGNGVVAANEGCDDMNTGNGDGCSSMCAIEAGYCCDGQPSGCIASPVALTFSSLALAIPDGDYDGTLGSMGCINLDVDICAGTVTDMDIAVGIDHTWIGDVVVTLVSPANTVVTLLNRSGHPASSVGYGSNLSASSLVLFDDAAVADADTMGSTLASAGIVCQDDGLCNYSPNPDGGAGNALADFNGETVAGLWTVCVGDADEGTTGMLQTVQLLPTFN